MAPTKIFYLGSLCTASSESDVACTTQPGSAAPSSFRFVGFVTNLLPRRGPSPQTKAGLELGGLLDVCGSKRLGTQKTVQAQAFYFMVLRPHNTRIPETIICRMLMFAWSFGP